MPAEVRYHPLEARNLRSLVDLESELRVALAGVQSRRLYRILAQDAVGGDRRVVCLVCETGGRVAGFVLALIHPSYYWKDLARRHPLMAVQILLARTFQRAQAGPPPEPTASEDDRLFESGASPGSWAESSDTIAKIQFIGVDPDFRGKGIGVELYRRLADYLRGRGLSRIDAHIAAENAASIRLHHAAGWKLYREAGGVFAIYSLESV